MVYKVVRAWIQNDGSVTEGKRKQTYQTRSSLNIGGLYFIGKHKLVRVLAKIRD